MEQLAKALTRRRFLGFTLGAAAGTTLGWNAGNIGTAIVSGFSEPVVRPARGTESHVLSVCNLCPGGCGLRVRCIGGRPVKVDGNPLHPISAGRLCPRGQAALQSLYHPDRITRPLRRVGPKGSLGSYEPATWEQALEEIAVRLALLRRQGRPEALGLVRRQSHGVGARLVERFVRAFGSPNDVDLSRGDEAASEALLATHGIRAMPAYDLQSAEYVLSFGGGLLEDWNAPVYTMRAYGAFRQGRAGRRGKLVQAEPRLSATGQMADEWVPLRPGTEGVLAMGVASALVAEELYDKEFVARRTHQFEDYHDDEGNLQEGLRTLLLNSFGLERVAAETGTSVNRILRLAREFAAARPGVAVGPRRGTMLSGRVFDHLAAHLLNALVGNIDGPGGVLVPEQVSLSSWPELPADPVAEAGLRHVRLDGTGRADPVSSFSDPEGFAEAVLAGAPYELGALFLVDADPAFSSMSPQTFVSAVERVPLVISITGLPNDTALLSDWILPPAHFLESWDLHRTPPGVPFLVASLSKPVLPEPEHDVLPLGDIFLQLARRIGGNVAQAFPWPDVPAVIRAESDALFDARRGAVMGTPFDEAWVRLMERAGWWAPGYRSADELWELMGERGGWWDPFYDHWNWSRVLRTPSGRFEFRPGEVKQLAEHRQARPPELEEAPGVESRADRSLTLLLFEPLAVAGGDGADLPFLQEILDPLHDERWGTWVELHPDTARALGVRDRASVRVLSSHGWIEARAQVSTRVVPGVAAIPLGLGRRSARTMDQGRGSNPFRLLSPPHEPLTMIPDPEGMLVRIVPQGSPNDDRGSAEGRA